ncbi:MAG: hypothetical protein E7Z85_04690 [Methanosphaera stadtmanae]|nr:hypothetical protein [Methanosphaera stadtmanae]
MKKVFSNIIIPRIAYDELKNRMDLEIQRTIKSLTRSKFVILEDFEINSPEFKLYSSLKKGIECRCRGKCESAAITIAKYNSLTILSNHQWDYVDEFDLNYISMSNLLINAYKNELINMKEAEIIWSEIRTNKDSINFLDFYENQ